MSKTNPHISVSGSTNVVKMISGTPSMGVSTSMFLVVGGVDQTPAADTKSGTTDTNGNLTLTSITLASGRYHVQTTFPPVGIHDGTAVIR